MPIANPNYRKCRSCGKLFLVMVGDNLDGTELSKMLYPICDQCRAKEAKSMLSKLFKKDST